MAKLDFAANQIQSTTNMLKYPTQASEWTNDKYPSAQAVADLVTTTTAQIIEACENASGSAEYPIGSVIIMGSDSQSSSGASINPNGKLSGTWIQIDKEFKSTSITLGKDPSTPTSTPGSSTSIGSETIFYNDHSLLLQLDIQVRSSSTITAGIGQDPVLLASLSIGTYGNYGVTKLSSSVANNIAFATPSDLKASSVICYSIDSEGKLWLNDILNDGTGTGNATRQLAGGTHIYINTVIPVPYTDMKDNYCDKFYWKRTA
jgi:hypothetical protein